MRFISHLDGPLYNLPQDSIEKWFVIKLRVHGARRKPKQLRQRDCETRDKNMWSTSEQLNLQGTKTLSPLQHDAAMLCCPHCYKLLSILNNTILLKLNRAKQYSSVLFTHWNNLGSTTLLHQVHINIATTWLFLAVYVFGQRKHGWCRPALRCLAGRRCQKRLNLNKQDDIFHVATSHIVCRSGVLARCRPTLPTGVS